MGATENNRMRIQQAVRETERLIGQKQNNLAMIKARQTLEFIVNCLGEKALIVDGDLADSIDQLYEGRWISQTARNHFHRIRVIGNKAVHEGNDSPYDANEAYQLLAQEVHAFLNVNGSRSGNGTPPRQPQRQTGQRPPSQASRNAYSQRNSHPNHSSHRPSSVSRSRRRPKKRGFQPYVLIRPAIILIIVLILAFTVYGFLGKKGNKKESTTAPTTEMITTAPTEPTETEPQTTVAPKLVYKTTATPRLNVRATPKADGALLGTLAPGTIVDYVGMSDDDWAIIMFEGKQAYVSDQFLSSQEEDGDPVSASPLSLENGGADETASSVSAPSSKAAAAAKPKAATEAKPKAATAAKPKAAAAAKPKAATTAAKPKATTAAKPKAATAAQPAAATTTAGKPSTAAEPANVPTISNKPAD